MELDLLVQALTAIENMSPDDPKSYYAIAGIHGMPYEPYNGSTVPDFQWAPELAAPQWGGYCHHGDVLFPTWHRAYMLQIEGVIREQATAIAGRYSQGSVRNAYIKAANRLRFPYWDWAAEVTGTRGIPDVFTNNTLMVNTPPYNLPTRAANPMRAFSFTKTTGTPFGVGDQYNPQNGALYAVPPGSVYMAPGYSTIRQPTRGYATNDTLLTEAVKISALTTFIPGVYELFQVPDFRVFSNHYATAPIQGYQNATQFLYYASIEGLHDSIHRAVGGLGGHMRFNTMAAFDPIFFFHHSNVDRLFALWQHIYPDQWIQPSIAIQGTYTIPAGTSVDDSTPLTPFYSPNGEYFVSFELRDVIQLGYTYPELMETDNGRNTTAFKRKILNYYRPNKSDAFSTRWYLGLKNVTATQLPGAVSIHVFINPDERPTVDTPLQGNPNYCGSADFSSGKTSAIQTFDGEVSLTKCFEILHLTLYPVIGNPSTANITDALSSMAGYPVLYSNLFYVISGYDGSDFSEYVAMPDNTIFYVYEQGDERIRGSVPKTPNIIG
jgi:tyrosinase